MVRLDRRGRLNDDSKNRLWLLAPDGFNGDTGMVATGLGNAVNTDRDPDDRMEAPREPVDALPAMGDGLLGADRGPPDADGGLAPVVMVFIVRALAVGVKLEPMRSDGV